MKPRFIRDRDDLRWLVEEICHCDPVSRHCAHCHLADGRVLFVPNIYILELLEHNGYPLNGGAPCGDNLDPDPTPPAVAIYQHRKLDGYYIAYSEQERNEFVACGLEAVLLWSFPDGLTEEGKRFCIQVHLRKQNGQQQVRLGESSGTTNSSIQTTKLPEPASWLSSWRIVLIPGKRLAKNVTILEDKVGQFSRALHANIRKTWHKLKKAPGLSKSLRPSTCTDPCNQGSAPSARTEDGNEIRQLSPEHTTHREASDTHEQQQRIRRANSPREPSDNLTDEQRVEAMESIVAEAACSQCGGFHLTPEDLKSFGSTPERGLLSNGKPMLCNGRPSFDKQVILDYILGGSNKGWYDAFKTKRGIPCFTAMREVPIPADLFGTPCTAVLDDTDEVVEVYDRNNDSLFWILSDAHKLDVVREYAILHYVEATPESDAFVGKKKGQKLPLAECRECLTVFFAGFKRCTYCGSESYTLLSESGEMFRIPSDIIGTEVNALLFNNQIIDLRTKVGEGLRFILCPSLEATLIDYIKTNYDTEG